MYCYRCGAQMGEIVYPHKCANCQQEHYRNPIPVIVGLVPVQDDSRNVGMLLITRKGGYADGKKALPGGFMDFADESVGHTISREIREETGVELPADTWHIVGSGRSRDGHLVIFVAYTHGPLYLSQIPVGPIDNPEVSEISVGFDKKMKLAFPLHTEFFRERMDWENISMIFGPEKK